MLRRLLIGLVLGLIVGGLAAAALVAGLHIPLDSFDVSLTPGKPAILSSVDASRWSIESFNPSLISDTSYAAAVVAQGQDWTVRYFEWKQSHEQARLQD